MVRTPAINSNILQTVLLSLSLRLFGRVQIGVELESYHVFELEVEGVIVVELLLAFVADQLLGNYHPNFDSI